MTAMSPIFPMPETHHYSDYGFDAQIDYFQVLEEARRQTKRAAIDPIHFKLSKPISKARDRPKPNKRRKWWKSALGFLKSAKGGSSGGVTAYPYRTASGPVYVTEPVSGRSTPCCRSVRSASGPLTSAEVGEGVLVPYVSLRDVNVAGGDRISSPMPIYLVT